jgi:hypothetical protein
LADISGVFDATNTIAQEVDEINIVIRENSQPITDDFDGDSFDAGGNCYLAYRNTLTDLGYGEFEFTNSFGDEYTAAVTISGSQLLAETTFG